jgi:hypothetical protein
MNSYAILRRNGWRTPRISKRPPSARSGPRRAKCPTIAAAVAETISREVDYPPIEGNGAARAAALIAPLLEEGKPRLRRNTTAI